MPAEWEGHEATWIGWPSHASDWPGKLEAVEWVFVEIVRHLASGEHVHILARDDELAARGKDRLRRAGVLEGAYSFHICETNRNWLRDAGAIFVRRAEEPRLRAMRFQFNGWAKYDNYALDQRVPVVMAEAAGTELQRAEIAREDGADWMVLEGGAIDTNGAGLLLTTEECMLSSVQERNPGYSKAQIEAGLKTNLGIDRIIWLGRGVGGDDTHGHVDDIARFVNERMVVAMEEPDGNRPNHSVLRENLDRLRAYRDEQGALEVVTLAMPEEVAFEGETLPASYANFYIANETVLVPTFNDPNDRVTLGILQELFPERTVRGIHSVDLVWGLGTIHCLTQQQPRG
jgi:agmatine deiminase